MNNEHAERIRNVIYSPCCYCSSVLKIFNESTRFPEQIEYYCRGCGKILGGINKSYYDIINIPTSKHDCNHD